MTHGSETPQTPGSSSRSLGWLVAAAALIWGGLYGPRIGFQLAERYAGQKLGGVLEGDWFLFFGLVFLAVAWTLAYRAAHRALWGR